ncbi:MAG: DNA-protecting protein DprA [Candidatus Neomarinimicrobiota bacterium]|nr:MAG: DNA-protecting protein DprA [Candidatus Neomarinimicrobiota bacterium]
MDRIEAILNLLQVKGLGSSRIKNLYRTYPDCLNPFQLTVTELCQIPGIDLITARKIKAFSELDFGARERANARKLNTIIVSFYDDKYPQLLRKIYSSPVLLYIRGDWEVLHQDALAVVGTRSMTNYGRTVTRRLVQDLVEMGLVIVSGLALGIDTVAHEAALEYGGKTVAVLGSGIDRIYPDRNRSLARRIVDGGGALVSEFPIGTKPDAPNFPQRNRIISGLSLGTVVVEAGHRSGAILTALNAVDQNRDVFAVPGRVTDKQSAGCNRLIKNGAIPVARGEDIVDQLLPHMQKPPRPVQQSLPLDLTAEEEKVLSLLTPDPIHIDDLAQRLKWDVVTLLPVLLELELKGAVQQVAGKQFMKGSLS